jgi:hypothetical protein
MDWTRDSIIEAVSEGEAPYYYQQPTPSVCLNRMITNIRLLNIPLRMILSEEPVSQRGYAAMANGLKAGIQHVREETSQKESASETWETQSCMTIKTGFAVIASNLC